MYMPDIVARDIRDVDLASSGGITHTWYSGSVLFPFGFGLSYAQFSFTMHFHGHDAQRWSISLHDNYTITKGSQEEKTLRVRVSNTGRGSVRSDCVVLVFIETVNFTFNSVSPSAPPVPREALVAFQRLRNISPGDVFESDFKLQFLELFSAFRDEEGSVHPPRGTYALRIGHSSGESQARLSIIVS
jgi:beta-D-xylosidase 4